MFPLNILVLAVFVSQYICGHASGSLQQITGTFPRNLLHEGLFKFLSGALHNFPTWVSENNFDPFQLSGEFVTVTNASTNITLTVTNQYVTGFSRITRIFNSAVSVGLDSRSFEVSFATKNNILLGGDYEATGLYQGKVEINFRGKFSISCGNFWQGISFDNLKISENDSYVHLYSGNISYSSVATFENVSFTNIGLGEDQNDEFIQAMNTELGAMYYKLITEKLISSNSSFAIPSSRLLIRYINTLFWKTKVSDILNWSTVSNWEVINHSTKFVPNVFVVFVILILTLYNTSD